MKNKNIFRNLALIVVLMLSISFVSCITIYAGESVELELEKPYEYYSIVGNLTEVILQIIQDGNNVTIIPDKYSLEDSYEIIFFDREKEVITVSSGGGSRTIYEDRNITKYVYRNVTKYIERETPKEPEQNIEDEGLELWIRLTIGFVAGILVWLIIIILSNKFRKREKEDLKGGNEK